MNETTQAVLLIGFAVVLLVAAIIFTPLIFIWSVNTLFGCGVKYTLLNWFAALVLMSFGPIGTRATVKKS